MSLQCQIFLLSLPRVGMHQGLLWHSSYLELQVHPSWESLLWSYQAVCTTVWPPRLHGLRLVHRPEWRCFCGLAETRMEMSLLEMGVQLILPTRYYQQLLLVQWMPHHAGASNLLLELTHLHVVGMLWFMSDINRPSLPTPFYSVCVSISAIMTISTVFHSINSPDNSPFPHSVLPVLPLPHWFFQLYISFWQVSFSLDTIPSSSLGSKYQLNN